MCPNTMLVPPLVPLSIDISGWTCCISNVLEMLHATPKNRHSDELL